MLGQEIFYRIYGLRRWLRRLPSQGRCLNGGFAALTFTLPESLRDRVRSGAHRAATQAFDDIDAEARRDWFVVPQPENHSGHGA
jgi:hypothetical protein